MKDNVMDNKNIMGLIEQQKRLGRARNTISVMINSFRRVSDLVDFNSLESIDRKQAQEIVMKLSEKGYSNSTIKLTLVYLKELYDYVELEHPFYKVKYPTKKRSSDDGHNFFSLEEAKRILEVAKGEGRKKSELRNGALFSLLLLNGLRKSEAKNLNREDLDFENNRATLYSTKREEKVVIDIADSTMELIKKYLDKRDDDLQPVFVSSYKQRFSDSGLDVVVDKVLKKARVSGSAHDLRATCSSLMHEQGYDLISIKTKLRHKSSQTTLGYINQAEDKRRQLANAIEL